MKKFILNKKHLRLGPLELHLWTVVLCGFIFTFKCSLKCLCALKNPPIFFGVICIQITKYIYESCCVCLPVMRPFWLHSPHGLAPLINKFSLNIFYISFVSSYYTLFVFWPAWCGRHADGRNFYFFCVVRVCILQELPWQIKRKLKEKL